MIEALEFELECPPGLRRPLEDATEEGLEHLGRVAGVALPAPREAHRLCGIVAAQGCGRRVRDPCPGVVVIRRH